MNLVRLTTGTLCEFIKNELIGLYPEKEISSLTDLICGHVLNIPGHEIHLDRGKTIRPEKTREIQNIISNLKEFKPIQYIIGYTDFFGMRFIVNPDVLIPRPETEELVKWIIDDNPETGLNVIDIGTGSGCIAITLKKYLPEATVYATDVSETALAVAYKNAGIHSCEIYFYKHDIVSSPTLNLFPGSGIHLLQSDIHYQISTDIHPEFDIIVSNPPYIPAGDKEAMDKNVVLHEPSEALFVPDNEPFLYYEKIADFGLVHLKTGGRLYLEIHEKYGAEIKSVLTRYGYTGITIKKDINNKNRMIKANR